MEISPIAAIRIAPTFRSRETDLGLTDVFEIENSSRTGDETYSPSGGKAAGGSEEGEAEAEAESQEESSSEDEEVGRLQKTENATRPEISFFA